MDANKRMDVGVVVERIVGRLAQVDPSLRKRRRELADQLERACMSLMLNLGESIGNQDGNRRLRIETAAGSAGEIRRGLRFAMLWRMRQRCG